MATESVGRLIMDVIFGRFFDHPGQLIALGSVFAVWICLSGLGALIGGRDRIDAMDGLLGWAVVCVAFTVLGVFTPLQFYPIALALAVVGIVGLVVARRQGGHAMPVGFWRLMMIAAPLLIAASAMVGSQWDEFSHWLPSLRFLVDFHVFPDSTTRSVAASYPAYPYGWVFLPYLASVLSGDVIESAAGLFNLILLFSFGLLVLRVARTVAGDASPASAPSWGLLALTALFVTILNPTFVQKIVLTNYADTSTAVCVGAAMVLGCLSLTAEAQGDRARAMRRMIHAALILMVLVTLKQATFGLFAIVIGAIGLVGLVDRGIVFSRVILLSLVLAVPGLLLHAVWRYHVMNELAGAEFIVPAVGDWLFHIIPAVLQRMAIVLSNKGVYFAIMVLAVIFAVRSLFRCHTLFDRIAIATGAIFVAHTVFLLLAYISVMGEFNAVNVMSFWRYNMHVGGTTVAFLAVGLATLWRRYGQGRVLPKWWAAVPLALIIILPIALSKKIRFDHEPNKPHFRAVGEAIRPLMIQGSSLLVIDPNGTGESGLIARFEIHGHATLDGYLGAGQAPTPDSVRDAALNDNTNYVLIHSVTDAVTDVFGEQFAPYTSYLLEKDDAGTWTQLGVWPYPEDRL